MRNCPVTGVQTRPLPISHTGDTVGTPIGGTDQPPGTIVNIRVDGCKDRKSVAYGESIERVEIRGSREGRRNRRRLKANQTVKQVRVDIKSNIITNRKHMM